MNELEYWRARINDTRQTYNYAATVDFVPRPEHRLTVALFGTPSFNKQMRSVFGPGLDAVSSPSWAREQLNKTNTDVTARWVSKLFDRRWPLEANAGLHHESYNDRSPDGALNNLNQLEYHNTNLWDLEQAPGCEPIVHRNATTGAVESTFQPCPVGVGGNPYHTGGFGLVRQYTGNRWMGELKSTHLLTLGGQHEIKYGVRTEYSQFEQDRSTRSAGLRGLLQLHPNGGGPVGAPFPYFSRPPSSRCPRVVPVRLRTRRSRSTDLRGRRTTRTTSRPTSRACRTRSSCRTATARRKMRNLTINLGARLEMQRMVDTYDVAFLDTNNLGPRFGAIYDPTNDGRSKLSVSYGRYFEAIPMNMAARYFGGEGIVNRNGVPLSTCAQPDAFKWTGNAEWNQCDWPALGGSPRLAAGGTQPFNNGSSYPVQANLKGQYHNEIVATAEREIMEDLTVRADYIHRWIGKVIEDGTADPSGSLRARHPGDIPQSSIDAARSTSSTPLNAMDQNNPRHRGADRGAPRRRRELTPLGPGGGAQAGADVRRDHAVGEQALLEELVHARLVHVFAPGG